jgi:hypothetical protein
VYFALNDTNGTLIDVGVAILLNILGDDGLAAVDSQRLGEAVAADGYYSDFDYWNIVHNKIIKNKYCLDRVFCLLLYCGLRGSKEIPIYKGFPEVVVNYM